MSERLRLVGHQHRCPVCHTWQDVDEVHVLGAMDRADDVRPPSNGWDGSFVRYAAPHPNGLVACPGSGREVERGGAGSFATT